MELRSNYYEICIRRRPIWLYYYIMVIFRTSIYIYLHTRNRITRLLGRPTTTYVSPCCPKIPIFVFLGDFWSSSDPIFILYYAMPYANLHTRFQKNPFMFPECRPDTNLLRFHASWNVKNVLSSLCIAKFQLKISQRIDFLTLFSFTCIPNFERIRPCL
jgi:hypothetical protein